MISIAVLDDQKEVKQHGTGEFPVAVYHYVMSECVLGYINWHWHDEIQLCVVTKGRMNFQVSGAQYLLSEGEGFFVNSGRLHTARPVGDPDSAYLCLDFHPRILGAFPGSAVESKYVTPFIGAGGPEHGKLKKEIPWQHELLEEIRAIGDLYDEKAFGYEMAIQARIGLLWLALLRNTKGAAGEESGQEETGELVRRIMAYLRAHFTEPVSLEGIAREVMYSGSECCRQFRKTTGETIFHYLKAYRLARATELLEETDWPVSRIALETGFCSSSYFIEAFRAELKTTPLKYRNRREDPSSLRSSG